MKAPFFQELLNLHQLKNWQKKINNLHLEEEILAFNQHLFPHLYVIATMLLGLELITYRGFTFKYLFIDARLMTAIATISFLVIFIQRLKREITLPSLTKLVLDINKLAILPLLLLNYLLISLDIYYYQNYVYSNFHINSNNLQLIVSINLLIVILQLVQHNKNVAIFVWKRASWKAAINILFLLAVTIFAMPNIQTISKWMYDGSIKMIRTAHLNRKERFIYLSGGEKSTGWITHYTDFINKHVEKRGVIFIPPQKEAWQMEGNPYYMRWFLYPRFTVQSQDIVAPIPDEAEYILIDNGAWPGMTEYGWPRIAIPAAKIEFMVFIDRDTRAETYITNQAYDPDTMSYKWGVIKLRKEKK